jgi:hypothetical protein
MLKSAALGVALLLLTLSETRGFTLVSTNADWQFRPGTTEASLPDRGAWRQADFDDASWETRPATFYYGETNFSGTVLTNMQSAYTTIFLRKAFYVANPDTLTSLSLNAVCDDGFVAWINGVAVASFNPPTNGLDNITITSTAGTNATELWLYQTQPLPTPTSYLRPGLNVLAVQVFNVSLSSSDLVFNAELTAEPVPGGPLGVVSVTPIPGLLTNLTRVTVTFTEGVTGVQAASLLLNDRPATTVTGGGGTYTFDFPQPEFGTVQIDWDVQQHPIAAAADPSRTLQLSTPGVVWTYELVDPSGPVVASTQPRSGTTVRVLQEMEVNFDKPVIGVDPADLLINGRSATNLAGIGAGPYRFQFPSPGTGTVTFSWRSGHGITDDTPLFHPFAGGGWVCTLDPQAKLGDVIITEILADNATGLADEEGDAEPWLELHNRGDQAVDLAGWSLTDDPSNPGQWVFDSCVLPAQGYLTVFASGKDRLVSGPGLRLHTNFKLSPNGEYLGLFSPDAPRQEVSAFSPGYPGQAPNYSYGLTSAGQWRFFLSPTPGAANGDSPITNRVEAVHFSVERGFFATPFSLSLACDTYGAQILYTLDGSVPMQTNGSLYTTPIPIANSRIVRAVGFAKDQLPSVARTHTYLFNLPANRRYLPALSLVTATNNLYGKTGIMEYNPRNTMNHGIAWERPTSAELIRPEDNGGFQLDCGLRVAGGDYIRGLYNYRSTALPDSKYSFRLYFRGDYGLNRLHYPWFPGTTVDSFDKVHLRAGMNDPTNPFIRDELARQLESDVGVVASHGTFVNLFLNGVFKGYYNPAEHIDPDFLQTYHGGGPNWDVIAQMDEVHEGDRTAWNALKTFVNTQNLTNAASYLQLGSQVDLTNFVDYLLPLIYGDTDDWPHNNWRAARERVPDGRFRFYAWDSEFSYGFTGGVSHNTIANQLSNTSPPWGGTQIQTIFNKLKRLPEFKLLFADRVHKHLFNGGALTDERIRQTYDRLKAAVATTITGFNDSIGTSWIPNRRGYLLQHLASAGFLASSNAPVFSQFGGRVPAGFALSMTCTNGTIYYTTNGADPRVMFTGALGPDALVYSAALTLGDSVQVRARTLQGTNWSAVTEASFQVERVGLPIRFTEIMYNPPGGDAYEFVELQNLGTVAVDLQDFRFDGIDYRFPVGAPPFPPGARIVLASSANTNAFATRYPGLVVAGYYLGKLSNGGQRVALLDRAGEVVCSVDYGDNWPWPKAADGGGYSLEISDPLGDPNDPANWHASAKTGGSPGLANSLPAPAAVRLNEVMALNLSAVATNGGYPDWIELHNSGASSTSLQGWSLSDASDPRRFVFPAGAVIAAGGYLVVWCDAVTNASGFHTGFALDADGETVALYDAATNRIDVIRFGPQAADRSIGRTADAAAIWGLCQPTPNAPNQAAQLGSPASLALNEFLANAPVGGTDWIELCNRDASLPVALDGLYLAVSNRLSQVQSLSFVAPGGYVVLLADEGSGPRDLNLKLPATGGTLILSDTTGAEIDRLSYGSQLEGVSAGRLPNGTGALTSFPGNASPGEANSQVLWLGPVLNEFMARNSRTLTNASGGYPDWIELYNPGGSAFDLAGSSLSVGKPQPGEWTFPAGVSIPAHGYLLLWCDDSVPASTNAGPVLNVGRALNGAGDSLHLFNSSGQPVDSVAFGFQIVDGAVGRVGGAWQLLSAPTPGSGNASSAALGDPSTLRLNEWMADAGSGDDWFEVFNPATLPVNLAGLYLTDDPSLAGRTNFAIGPLTFAAPGGFLKWVADGHPEMGPDHVPFNLEARGETLRLNGAGTSVIDSVDFLAQEQSVSEGRWPDGSTNLVHFVRTASPGESNYLPLPSVVVNELLTHTDPPQEDAVELRNLTAQPVDLDGWYLSDSGASLKKYRIPAGTVIPANGYAVLYEYQFNPTPGTPASFELNSAHGGRLYLSSANALGNLTGFRAVLDYEPAANGVPFGRVETSVGIDLAPLSRVTLGAEGASTLAEFRTGRGSSNAAPLIGPVVISEIMYHPVTAAGTNWIEDPMLEFLELHNPTVAAVPLFDLDAQHPEYATNTWDLDGGVQFVFPPSTWLPARSNVLVVPFDPGIQPELLAAFRGHYNLPVSVPLFGPFTGRLSNQGEELRLTKPDKPEPPGGPDAGFVPYLLVDRVDYGPTAPWPTAADGTGASLQRRTPQLYGNEPLNWRASIPTPGSVTSSVADVDTDGDGMPDIWEDANGLNRLSPADASQDLDQDGLTNLQEYLAGTNPHLADTDGDGIPDGWERAYGLDPLNPLDAGEDPDHDGLTNLQEAIAGTDPWNPVDANADTDGDGFTNLQEWMAGTDPLDARSRPALEILPLPAGYRFRFVAEPGRSYTIQYADSLPAAGWRKLRDQAPGLDARLIELTMPQPTSPTARFFRLVTPIQP